jgi:hypothetical protein
MEGDAGTWVWTAPEGHRRTFHHNPLLLAERKAKKLKSLLTIQAALRTPRMRSEGFYLKSVIFLSDPDLKVALNEPGSTCTGRMHLRRMRSRRTGFRGSCACSPASIRGTDGR